MNQYSQYFFTCVLLSLPYISTELFSHPFPRAHQLNAQHVISVEEQVILLINPGSWILQYFSGNFFHWKPGCQLIFCMCVMSGEYREETSQLRGRVDACCPKQGASNSQIQTTEIKRNTLFIDFIGLWIKSTSFTNSAMLENSVLQNQGDRLTNVHSHFNICPTLIKASCHMIFFPFIFLFSSFLKIHSDYTKRANGQFN